MFYLLYSSQVLIVVALRRWMTNVAECQLPFNRQGNINRKDQVSEEHSTGVLVLECVVWLRREHQFKNNGYITITAALLMATQYDTIGAVC